MTLTEYLNKLPPYAIRMIATSDCMALSTQQIAQASGLSRRLVQRMSYSQSWAEFSVEDVSRFLEACGCGDTGKRWRYAEHIKRITSGLARRPMRGETVMQYLKRVIPLRHIKSRKVKHELLGAVARSIHSGRAGEVQDRSKA